MKGKLLLIMALVLMPTVFADHNVFDPYVDRSTINWFDRGLYKNVVQFQPCIDLKEFYDYADSNPYDNLRRRDIKEYKDKLSRDDYYYLADEDPFDNIKRRDLEELDDFYCSSKPEYDDFASSNRFDQYDEDDYYRLRGYRNKHIYDNYGFEYRFSRAEADDYASRLGGWRFDGNGGVASWYR